MITQVHDGSEFEAQDACSISGLPVTEEVREIRRNLINIMPTRGLVNLELMGFLPKKSRFCLSFHVHGETTSFPIVSAPLQLARHSRALKWYFRGY